MSRGPGRGAGQPRKGARAAGPGSLPTKPCAVCGRSFRWRKKWADCWDEVTCCSARCRRQRSAGREAQLELALLGLLDERDAGKSVCPSEVARALDAEGWRALMEPVRQAARRLAHRGQVQITQRGAPVDPDCFKGPIRVRRVG